jgi:hypothetical protein
MLLGMFVIPGGKRAVPALTYRASCGSVTSNRKTTGEHVISLQRRWNNALFEGTAPYQIAAHVRASCLALF